MRRTTPPGGFSPIPPPAAPLIFGPRRIATTGSTTETTRRGSGAPERPTILHRPSRSRPAPSGPGRAPATGAPPPVPGAGRAGSRRRPRRPSAGPTPRCPSSGARLPSRTGRRRRTGPSRGALVRMVRDRRARPSLPARPGPRCPPVTSGGGTTPCRRPPGSRPCPICRRGHPRPGTAPEAPRRTRTGSPTRPPRAVGYPDASGPLSPIPPNPGMNPGTAGRRWTERPAGWRTAPVQGEAPTGRATSATSGGGSAHTDTGRAVAVGASSASGSLIGDALLRELLENGLPARRAEPSRVSGVSDTVVFELDPRSRLHSRGVTEPPRRDPAGLRAAQVSQHGARCPGRQAPASTGSGRTGGRTARPPAPPDERRGDGVPRRPAGTVRPRWTRSASPLRSTPGATSTTVTAVRPGRTGATDPRAPPQITAGTRVTRRTPGRPEHEHTRPGRLLAPAGCGPIRHLRHRRPRPRRPAGRRARRLPRHLSPSTRRPGQDLQPGSPGPAQGRVGHATGLPWSSPGRPTPAPARSPGGHARDQSDP